MSVAWQVKRSWNKNEIQGYRSFVVNRAFELEKEGKRYTCEDLAIGILMDYALKRQLPMKIINGRWPKGLAPQMSSRIYTGQKSNNLKRINVGEQGPSIKIDRTFHCWDFKKFKQTLLKTTGARDLGLPDNTSRVGTGKKGGFENLKLALPGDLILLENSPHIQVVLSKTPTKKGDLGHVIKIAQGNFIKGKDQCTYGLLFSDKNRPGSKCYLGDEVVTKEYDQNGILPESTGGKSDVFNIHTGVVLRWRFESWNSNPNWPDFGSCG